MEMQPDGFWTITTPSLVPGLHYYTLIIDGAEVSDTSSQAFFGGSKYASAVEVPEPGSTYYSIQDVPRGQVREVWYNSKVTGSWRHALVYLPPNYDSQTKVRYPVLYLQLFRRPRILFRVLLLLGPYAPEAELALRFNSNIVTSSSLNEGSIRNFRSDIVVPDPSASDSHKRSSGLLLEIE